jgi:hypothetical protein
MSKISPLTVILFAIVLFLSSLIVLKKSNIALKDEQYNLTTYNQLTKEYYILKNSLLKGNKAKEKLEKILKTVRVKNYSLSKKQKKIILVFQNDINKVDKLINKLLNTNFIIKTLKIKKDNVTVEVGY